MSPVPLEVLKRGRGCQFKSW